MTTANKITVVRILMIPVFVTLAIYYGQSIQEGDPQDWQRFAAIAVFLLAAVSDGLDGYVARRYNQRSSLGMILDPIADKGLLNSLMPRSNLEINEGMSQIVYFFVWTIS